MTAGAAGADEAAEIGIASRAEDQQRFTSRSATVLCEEERPIQGRTIDAMSAIVAEGKVVISVVGKGSGPQPVNERIRFVVHGPEGPKHGCPDLDFCKECAYVSQSSQSR